MVIEPRLSIATTHLIKSLLSKLKHNKIRWKFLIQLLTKDNKRSNDSVHVIARNTLLHGKQHPLSSPSSVKSILQNRHFCPVLDFVMTFRLMLKIVVIVAGKPLVWSPDRKLEVIDWIPLVWVRLAGEGCSLSSRNSTSLS